MATSAQDAIAAKKWDGDGVPLAESNCAEIGTEADKAARKAAANGEPAWESAGKAAGLEVWRIENFKVVAWPKKEYGNFYTGDSYIILETKAGEGDVMTHKIYFWLGEETSTDEKGTAAYKTVELDDFFDGEPVQAREVQGSESAQFKALFPRISYLKGGVASGFNHVDREAYQPRLMHVKKHRGQGAQCFQVDLARESLNQGDSFILDAGRTIYIWHGAESGGVEKFAATQAAENMEANRDGEAKTTLDIDEKFWELLGGEGEIAGAVPKVPDPEPTAGELFRLSDTTGELKLEKVAEGGDIEESMLESDNVMLLDVGCEVFVWIGSGASAGESRNAIHTAVKYVKTSGKPLQTPVHALKENSKSYNPVWNSIVKK